MHFVATRKNLLNLLQLVIGVVERRQTMPMLAHALLEVTPNGLSILATDLEVELSASSVAEQILEAGKFAVPVRKLLDIVKALPENNAITMRVEGQKFLLTCNKSHFTLATLPADDFPMFKQKQSSFSFEIPQKELRYLIEQVYFSIAQQDVRYFLNGLLLEINNRVIRSVTSDGHRLSMCTLTRENSTQETKVIIPRKGITELLRLLEENDRCVAVTLSDHSIRIQGEGFILNSKLIDGIFPDYEKVFFREAEKRVVIQKDLLKHTLERVSVLANEKNHVVRLMLGQDKLTFETSNSDLEQARDELDIDYHGESLDIGFNVNYLLQAVNALASTNLILTFSDSNSSVLVEGEDNFSQYVIMPMRL